MIAQLRETMTRRAATVVPLPSPYERVLARRKRRLAVRTVMAAVTTMLIAIPVLFTVDTTPTPPATTTLPTAGQLTPAVRALLDTPTRGSLAGDVSFLDAIRRRAALEVNQDRGGPAALRMPDDINQIKVLYAGDLDGGERIAIVAGDTAWPLKAEYVGRQGADASAMHLSGSGSLEAMVEYGSENPQHPYALFLAPAGSLIETAGVARYTTDGPQYDWTAVGQDSYLSGVDPHWAKVRISFRGTVLKETIIRPRNPVGGADITLDPASVTGVSEQVQRAARRTAAMLAYMTGVDPAKVAFRLLWSGEAEVLHLSTPQGIAVTVYAQTADSGGPYATAVFDPQSLASAYDKFTWVTHPTGEGVLRSPATSLIVMRFPYTAPYTSDVPPSGPLPRESDTLQLIAPPHAVRAELVENGSVVQQVTLTDGFGRTSIRPKVSLVVKTFDAQGNLVAQQDFNDIHG